MKLVQTLLVRDEADVVEQNIRFHLSRGVDEIIVTDNLSEDETPAILRRLEAEGRVRVLEETSDDYSQGVWVTRMARLAREEHGADWVIHADADEFWWPKSGNLKACLESVPEDRGMVHASRLNFVPRRDGSGEILQRMTLREVVSKNSLGGNLPAKVCHRARADAVVSQGNHGVTCEPPLTLVLSEPIVILHFPLRTFTQFENKVVKGGSAYARNEYLPKEVGATWRDLYQKHQTGQLEHYFESQVLAEEEVDQRIANGSLIHDRRLAVALTALGIGAARPLDDGAFDLESALEVEGWMTPPQLGTLARLAATVAPSKKIVEVGSYRGRTTLALAAGSRSGGEARIYSFDPHEQHEGPRGGRFGPADQQKLYETLAAAGVGESVFAVSLDSRIAAAGWPHRDVGLLVVDGDHREESVRADFDAWRPHLVANAIVAFDDIDYVEVGTVISELVEQGRLAQVGEVASLAWFVALE